MRTFRRIMLLGVFAAAGTGLALCVAISAPEAADRQKSQTPGPAAERASHPRPHRDGPRQPHARPAELDTPYAGLAVPRGPVVARPYPPRTFQIIPKIGKDRLQRVNSFLQREFGVGQPPAAESSKPASSVVAKPAAAGSSKPASSAAVKATAVATIDSEGDGKLSMHFKDEDIRTVLEMLSDQAGLNILAGRNVKGKVSATLRNVDVESALEAILKSTGLTTKREGKFIYVGTPEDFVALEQAMDKIGTRVYRPNYVTAAELQSLITPLLTEKVGVASVSSAAETGIGSDDASAGGDSYAGADVVVVRDYEAVLAQIDQMVEEIDVRPLQVCIEAMILSVKLKDEDKFGVNFELLRQSGNIKFGLGTPLASLADLKFDAGGLKFGFLDSNLGAFLDALESVGDTNVIATPRLMVLNKHRAEILIGEQKGYVSTTITETSSTESVEFLEVGAQLRLRPFISSDGLVRMEIHPELSDGSVEVKEGFTLPNKETTQVTTNIMVRDGCTVIIGGLMKEQLLNTTTQVPLFGNLPLVGFVFRNTTETIERREVLVLITPRIVYEPGTCQEGNKAASEFHRRQSTYADKMSPFGKRNIARRYFRLAQSAWAAGDRKTALRFAEMSVHFDPLSRKAIDLRSDIWLGRPHGDHTLDADAFAPRTETMMDAVDGQVIAGWLLDDLQREPVMQPAPVHPLDPGRPGTHKDIVRPRRFQ